MIDVKQAAAQAERSLRDIYDDRELRDVLLEEVELSEDRRCWVITLGFRDLNDVSIAPRRRYKSFRIDATTGDFLGMKMREV